MKVAEVSSAPATELEDVTVVPSSSVRLSSTSVSESSTKKSSVIKGAKTVASSLTRGASLGQKAFSSATSSITSLGNKGLQALTLDDEAAAAAATIQAIYRGNKERAMVQGKLLMKQMAKTGQLFNINFWGNPVSTTIKGSLDVGSPEDATCFERVRDFILAKMVLCSPYLLVVSALGALGLVCFGIFLLFLLFLVNFGVEAGDMTAYLYPECNSSAYNQSLVLSPTKPNYPPRIIGVGLDINTFGQPHYVQYYCTEAQKWFNICVKYFAFYFTYINLLPLPWTFSIFINATCPRKGAGGSGVDFYGRPSESLWFNLPRKDRRAIAFWLLWAMATQICAAIFHIMWFEYLSGQTWPGAFLQNVWLPLQFVGQIAASVIQAKAEKKLRLENPGRFPPTLDEYLKKAYVRWRAETQRQAKRPNLCCGKDSFLEFVKLEAKNFQEEARKFGKVDALTGVQIVALNEKVVTKLETKAGRDLNGDGAVSSRSQDEEPQASAA